MRVWVTAGATLLKAAQALLYPQSQVLEDLLDRDSIAQNAFVSDSAFGSILPGICNLAIACTCYVSVKNLSSQKYRYCKHITGQTPFELSAKIT